MKTCDVPVRIDSALSRTLGRDDVHFCDDVEHEERWIKRKREYLNKENDTDGIKREREMGGEEGGRRSAQKTN